MVENRGGANGGLGAQEVMRAEPDGYTLGAISDSPMTVNPWMYEKLAYSPLKDFIAVARVNHFPSLVVANPATGIKTIGDLIKVAKEKPGTLNYSSGGVGNFSHLGLAVVGFKTGVNIVHVPYRGVGPATTAVLAGDVQLMYNNFATAYPHVQAGKLNGLAVGGTERLPDYPDIPTVAETIPGFDVTPWVGVFAPAKTPNDVVTRLSKEVAALVRIRRWSRFSKPTKSARPISTLRTSPSKFRPRLRTGKRSSRRWASRRTEHHPTGLPARFRH